MMEVRSLGLTFGELQLQVTWMNNCLRHEIYNSLAEFDAECETPKAGLNVELTKQ
jgi:hypothetical protein